MPPAEGNLGHELVAKDGARNRPRLGMRTRPTCLPIVFATPRMDDAPERKRGTEVLAARDVAKRRQVLLQQLRGGEISIRNAARAPGVCGLAVPELALARTSPTVNIATLRQSKAVVPPCSCANHRNPICPTSNSKRSANVRVRRLAKRRIAFAAR